MTAVPGGSTRAARSGSSLPPGGLHPHDGPAARRPGALAAEAAHLAAVAVLTMIGGLLVWTLLPLVLGWTANVVLSGSMEPSVVAGDVVLTQPVPMDQLRNGMIVVFTDPDEPDRVVAHRLVAVDASGRLVTRGDANSAVDTWRVPEQDLRGIVRLRVPHVGLPALWVRTGNTPALLITFCVLATAALLAVRRPTPPAAGRSDGDRAVPVTVPERVVTAAVPIPAH